MPEHRMLRGAVITSFEKRSHGVVELLAARLRNRVAFAHYLHPHEVESRVQLDFIIVFTEDDLAGVVQLFKARRQPVPLIILIDDPAVIARGDYAKQFPGIKVAPIAQPDLQEKESTLKIIVFEDIIKRLAQLTLQLDTNTSHTSQNHQQHP